VPVKVFATIAVAVVAAACAGPGKDDAKLQKAMAPLINGTTVPGVVINNDGTAQFDVRHRGLTVITSDAKAGARICRLVAALTDDPSVPPPGIYHVTVVLSSGGSIAECAGANGEGAPPREPLPSPS